MTFRSKNNLPRIQTQVEKECSRIVRKTTFAIEARAKTLAPVDKGILRAGITSVIVSPTKGMVANAVEYSPDQEFGTRYQKGTPHMTPAADAEKKNFEKDLQNIERSLK